MVAKASGLINLDSNIFLSWFFIGNLEWFLERQENNQNKSNILGAVPILLLPQQMSIICLFKRTY